MRGGGHRARDRRSIAANVNLTIRDRFPEWGHDRTALPITHRERSSRLSAAISSDVCLRGPLPFKGLDLRANSPVADALDRSGSPALAPGVPERGNAPPAGRGAPPQTPNGANGPRIRSKQLTPPRIARDSDVNSFLEDHMMSDAHGWGTGLLIENSYPGRRPLVVECQHLSRRASTALTSEGSAC